MVTMIATDYKMHNKIFQKLFLASPDEHSIGLPETGSRRYLDQHTGLSGATRAQLLGPPSGSGLP